MVRISAEIKRALLRSLWSVAKPQGALLRDALQSYQNSQAGSLKSGRIVVGNSANGHSVSIEVPPQWREITQENVLALTELFINLYDDAFAVITSRGIPAPDDDTIFAVMMADERLYAVREQSGDFSMLNYSGF